MLTPRGGLTGVISARVIVAAILGTTWDAGTVLAEVSLGTETAIVTCRIVIGMNTSHIGIAGVIRANNVIITIKGGTTNTLTVCAGIQSRTRISVIAVTCQGHVRATRFRIAGVAGTHIVIAAGHYIAGLADSACTYVLNRAYIPIVARGRIAGMNTAKIRFTTIVSAEVLIIAYNRRPWYAEPPSATVTDGAQIGISTVTAVYRRKLAPGKGRARVCCADVVIVAGELARVPTFTQLTVVPGGANIVVVTRGIIKQVDATSRRHTSIIGADVAIVTIHGL